MCHFPLLSLHFLIYKMVIISLLLRKGNFENPKFYVVGNMSYSNVSGLTLVLNYIYLLDNWNSFYPLEVNLDFERLKKSIKSFWWKESKVARIKREILKSASKLPKH